jgi:predicted RNA-binding protein with RPS1 domain
MLLPFGVYEFEIDIYGNLDGEDIKPIVYTGSFDASVVVKSEYSITVSDLKITELSDKKTKKQTKKQPKEQKKEETLTKEGFMKALDKVIKAVKPKSPARGKKKTPE